MPSIYTHTVFANDVLTKLDKSTKKSILNNKEFYIMFSQSFDNFYYYNFLSIKKGKNIRKFGDSCHVNNVKKYFYNIINYIKSNNLQSNYEVLSYLYGAINHYVSDSMLHPFINYRTGRYSKVRKKETKKYIGVHTNTEIRIDAYYYEKITNKSFKKYKIYKDIPKLNFSKELVNTIDFAFKETFNKSNMGNIFNKSYNQSKLIYQLLMYDPLGIKLFCYKIIDFITPSKDKKIASYSLHKEPVSEDFFNRNHNHWCNPADNNIISEESWDDVYNRALKQAVLLIKKVNLLLCDKITDDNFFELLGNNNYVSGLDCSDKRILQYYER